MPQPYGLLATGFKPKSFHAIKEDIEKTLTQEVDPYLHFGAGSVAGVLTGIIANEARQVWESLAGLYSSLQPDTASGRALDALCSLTGTYRLPPSFSKATAKVTLEANTTLPAGSRVKTVAGDFFKTTLSVKNTFGKKADIEADLIAESQGSLYATNSEATIMTPVAGWSKTVITKTYEIGRLAETDDELRLRRIAQLKATGSSTMDAMRSRLLQLNGVDAVFIKEGEHTFEAIIKGGSEMQIAHTIWQAKPLGVKSSGSIEQKIKDHFGQERILKFSRPKLIFLNLNLKLKVKQSLDENALKTSLVEFARHHFILGGEVYPSRFFNTIFSNENVLDIISINLCELNKTTPPNEIKEDEIASLSFNDIFVEQIVEILP